VILIVVLKTTSFSVFLVDDSSSLQHSTDHINPLTFKSRLASIMRTDFTADKLGQSAYETVAKGSAPGEILN